MVWGEEDKREEVYLWDQGLLNACQIIKHFKMGSLEKTMHIPTQIFFLSFKPPNYG